MPVIPGVSFRGYGISQPNTPNVPAVGPAQGIAEIGKALSGAVGVLDEMADEEGRVYAAKAISQIRLKKLKELQDAELSGNPLDGLTGRIAQGVEDDFAAYAKEDADGNAAPERAGRYLELAKTDLLGDMSLSAQRLEGTDRVNRRIASIGETLRNAATAASTDPALFPKLWAEGNALIDSTAMPFEAREKARGDLRDVAASAIAGMIERNPYAAANQLESGQWDKYLDPNDRVSLYNGAQAGIRSREAEAKQRANEAKAAQAEAARIALEGADDALAFVAAGNNPTPEILNNYSPERIYALTGSEKAAKKAADAFARGEGVRELLNAGTPAERAKVIEDWRAKAADPENYQFNQDTLRILESGAADLNDKLIKDPGGVAEMSDRVQTAILSGDGVKIVAASYAEQERQGIPSAQRKPFSNAYAAQVAEQISSLPPDQQAAALQDLQQSYKSYWPDVLRQIGDKLPPGLAVAAVMPRGRGATTLASVAGLKIEDLTSGLEKGAKGDVEEAILNDERMQSLFRVLTPQMGGRETYAQYSDSVLRLALKYNGDGLSIDDAVAKAAQEVTGDTAFAEVGNSIIAIPANENRDRIIAGLEAAQSSIDLSTVDLPPTTTGYTADEIKSAYATSIRQNGEWVASGDGKGLYLSVLGDIVTRDGEPILFTWEDLKGAAPARGVYSVPSVDEAASRMDR